ncbi:MAG: hypothetical protein IPP42_17550 [Saprospiraceae bacterium]|nr:hypothetical protein [Saprospiraceae bacterium]
MKYDKDSRVKNAWKNLLNEKFWENQPTDEEVCMVLDQKPRTSGNYLISPKGESKLNFNDTRLLYYAFGIDTKDLERFGIPFKPSKPYKDKPIPHILKTYKCLDPVEKFKHLSLPAVFGSQEHQGNKNSYKKILLPYINKATNLLCLNSYLGKGAIYTTSIESADYYYDFQTELYYLIEKKLSIKKLDDGETLNASESKLLNKNFDEINSHIVIPVINKLKSYLRVLEISHRLYKHSDPWLVKLEAILLCPAEEFKHIIHCIFSKKENIKICASPLQRPYDYGVVDENYIITEYLRAQEQILLPDLLFIENIEHENLNSSELQSIYKSEFLIYLKKGKSAKSLYQITKDDIIKVFKLDKKPNELLRLSLLEFGLNEEALEQFEQEILSLMEFKKSYLIDFL